MRMTWHFHTLVGKPTEVGQTKYISSEMVVGGREVLNHLDERVDFIPRSDLGIGQVLEAFLWLCENILNGTNCDTIRTRKGSIKDCKTGEYINLIASGISPF